jgi:hypothetical protein
MHMKKTLMVAGAGMAVGLATFASVASAQTWGASNQTGEHSLVDKIATRFNLNKDEVQKVFDEDREAHHEAMKQKMEEFLAQAVKDDKITEDQKRAILDKHKEMQTFMESIKDKPAEEHKMLMKQKVDEIRQWAKDNDLTEYMRIGKIGFKGHQFMMHTDRPGVGLRERVE